MPSKSLDVVSQIRKKLTSSPILYRKEINASELADVLGASTTPVREALFQLVGEGLVESIPQKGFFHVPIKLQSSKCYYSLIHSIVENRLNKAILIHKSSLDPINNFNFYTDSDRYDDSLYRSGFVKDFYLALLCSEDDIEAAKIVRNLLLKTDFLRQKILTDDDAWLRISMMIRSAIKSITENDFSRSAKIIKKLHFYKLSRLDQAFNSLAFEHFAKG